MASSESALVAEQVHRRRAYAVGGVVRVLCSTRLLVLVLAAVEALLGDGAGPFALLALAAAPFSFVPVLNWNTRGPVYFRKGYLLAADIVVTFLVLIDLQGATLMVAYGGATVALWGATTGMRVASLMAVPVAVLVVPWTADDGWRSATGVVVSVGAVFAMVWAGKVLGDGVRRSQQVAQDLERERADHAADAERLRIARDLHDTVAGDLAGASLLAHGLCTRVERGEVGAATAELARALEEAVTAAHRHTRQALDELRTARDLRAELEAVVTRWTSRSGAEPEVAMVGPLESVPRRLGDDARAVLGELLENVRKHARATRVRVDVVVTDDATQVTVVVDDDGQGMPQDGAAEPGHYGLRGIRERAHAAAGSAAWGPSPLGGTRARVVLHETAAAGAAAGPAAGPASGPAVEDEVAEQVAS